MKKETPGISLEVYDPTGIIERTEHHAPRLKDLSGKTICEISNYLWEYDRIFPVIRSLLKKRFPDITIVPYTEFPRQHGMEADTLVKVLKERGCDGVIVGNAA